LIHSQHRAIAIVHNHNVRHPRRKTVRTHHPHPSPHSQLTTPSVRREDLYSSSSDDEHPPPAASAADAQRLHDHLAHLYGPISSPAPAPAPSTTADAPASAPGDDQEEEEAFEFRLFAAPHTADATTAPGAPAQRIVLSRSDDEGVEAGEGGFTAQRGREWYFVERATGRRREEFEVAAVGGEVVVRWSGARAWGLERPWRVRVVRMGSVGSVGKVVGKGVVGAGEGGEREREREGEEERKRRSKPNKKRRIVLRMRERALVEKREKERVAREREKDEAVKKEAEYAEKRTARNRERKIKRRERERRKKAAAAAGMPDPGGEESGSEDEGGGKGGEAVQV
jgi:hypothetical protein